MSRNFAWKSALAASLLVLSCGTLTAEEIVNSIGMRLVRIPAGEFLMGSATAEADEDERPQHCVRISRPFLLSCFEVTQAQYARVMGANPSWFSSQGGGREQVAGKDTSRHPADMVSWTDATEFCRRLSDSPLERAAWQRLSPPQRSGMGIAPAAAGNRGREHSQSAMRFPLKTRTSLRGEISRRKKGSRFRSVPFDPTRSDSTTCTATSGSGAAIGMRSTITKCRQTQIHRALNLAQVM